MDSPVGPDDACHCGSGRPYRSCCMQRDLEQIMQQRNQAAIDDFHGLSPEQMSAFLYAPFESPRWLDFPAVLTVEPEAPITQLFGMLMQALDAGELKATPKGNLPRAFSQQAHRSLAAPLPFSMDMAHVRVNKEEDFLPLHVTRLVAQEAGLLRKYKGRFILSKACKALRDADGMRALYPPLFRACARRFNWGYNDAYPDMLIIQQAFAFSLYLLSRYGGTPRSRQFYEDAFLRAFPMVIDEADSRPWSSAEEMAGRCFSLRTLDRFAVFMGLARQSTGEGKARYDEYDLAKTPLLDEVVRFHVA